MIYNIQLYIFFVLLLQNTIQGFRNHFLIDRNILTSLLRLSEKRNIIASSEYASVNQVKLQETEKIKILCLHGYLSNARLFQQQLGNLMECTKEFAEYHFIDAPHVLSLSSNNATPKRSNGKFRWWNAVTIEEDIVYDGLEESLLSISKLQKECGSFDVLLGHSQGACLVMILNYLANNKEYYDILENSSENNFSVLPKAVNSVLMSGFVPRDRFYGLQIRNSSKKYGIGVRSLHVFSDDDSVVPMSDSMTAMSSYKFPEMFCRNGAGHEPPSDDESVQIIASHLQSIWKRKYQENLIQLED